MRFLLPAALAYVAPTIIGWQRRIAGAGALAILNVLLGWTGVGWIVCMLWAVRAPPHQNQFYRDQFGRFTAQQIAEHEEFMRWKAEKSLPVEVGRAPSTAATGRNRDMHCTAMQVCVSLCPHHGGLSEPADLDQQIGRLKAAE